MSLFSEAATYSDLLKCYERIGDKLTQLRGKLGVPNTDARQTALLGMQLVVTGFFFSLSTMIHERNTDQILKSFGVHNLTPDGARRTVEDVWKLGLLTLFLFKVDTLLHNLLRGLGHPGERGFEGMAKKLFAAVGLADDRAIAILSVASAVRNSLHNNGIHRGRYLSMKCHDLDFDLVKGQQVDCASWAHVFAINYEVLEVLDIVLATSAARAIPTPFVDDYAIAPLVARHRGFDGLI